MRGIGKKVPTHTPVHPPPPPYHCELQPIEIVWAAIKNPIAASPASTMVELGNKIQQGKDDVSESVWLGARNKVLEWENKYWEHADELEISGSESEDNSDEGASERGSELDDDGEEV